MTSIQAVGIVAEYNPFHNGHAYHIAEAKRLTGLPVIAVMSGTFMQRGEPSILSPWVRAELAVRGGADLVLQLPATYSLRSAQYFAQGAVQTLAATGCVSHLACGVESPAIDFWELAQRLESSTIQETIRQHMRNGESYARACAHALTEVATGQGNNPSLGLPNDILALAYCQAIVHSKATIQPVFIERQSNQYNDTQINGMLASATAIRNNLQVGNKDWRYAVPVYVAEKLQNAAGYDAALLWQLIKYQLRRMSPEQIASNSQCSEGLENLLKQAQNCTSLQDALALCTNKRYSTSRIRRLLCQVLLDQPRELIEQNEPDYLRVLAFNDTGRTLLKQMRTSSSLPIITKLGKKPEHGQSSAFAEQMQLDLTATDIWSLLTNDHTLQRAGLDFVTSPVYVKK